MHESRTAPFHSVEAAFSRWLSVNASRHPETAPLVLVQISNDDLAAHPWPWSPMDYSLFFSAALPFQPPVLAVEPVLAWNSADPQQMALLHHQVLQAPKVLLGSELGFPEDPALVPPFQEVPVLRHNVGEIATLREFPLVAFQPSEDLRLAATPGFFEPAAVSDGQPVGRVPLVFRYRGQVVPSFVLQAAMLWFGVTAEEVIVVPGSHIALGKEISLPVDAAGTMAVDFTIPVIRFSMADLILSAEQHQSGHQAIAPVAQLKNAVTLLARTDTASRTIPLANGRSGSRGELAAAAIATIQRGSFTERAGVGIEGLILFEAIVLGWFCRRLSKLGAAALCGVVFCFYLLVALGTFTTWGVALPLLLPAGLLAFLVLFRQLE